MSLFQGCPLKRGSTVLIYTLCRYLEEKSSVAELNDTSELLQKSMETLFVGRCFAFRFGSVHENSEFQGAHSLQLSDVYQRQNIKKENYCQVLSSVIATGIKPLGEYSATVFAILESYFSEARKYIPSEVGMHAHIAAEIKSTPQDRHLDTSSSLVSPSQLTPALIQLESYCEPSPEHSASSLHNVSAISKKKSCSIHFHPSLHDSPAVRSHFPVAPVLRHVQDYPNPKDHNCCSNHDRGMATPSVVGCGGESDSEGTVFTDAEASKILQELVSDWERSLSQGTSLHSTKLQLDGLSPASASNADTCVGRSLTDSMLNPNLSVSGLSETFWAKFDQSFDLSTAPDQHQTGLSVLLPKPPTHDTTLPCGTPELFPSTQGVASISGLPSVVRREPGNEATESIGSSWSRPKETVSTTFLARSRATKCTYFSPELFGSSSPPVRFNMPPNCAQTSSKRATPALSRSCLRTGVIPKRRNLLKDITNTPHRNSPLEITTGTGLDETPTQLVFRTQSCNSTFSPELF